MSSLFNLTRGDARGPIPRLIHQTWKTADLPQGFRALQKTWTERNPGFTYRFWTDEDIARFIESEHPALLAVFAVYRTPIARIDLARYLILQRFGGVYADLDCECLRPLDGLLDGNGFVIGQEPAEHDALQKAVERGLSDLLCPSFIASVPGHPFWDHVLERIVEARHCPDVLDATGPFLLTRAYRSYAGPAAVTAPVAVVPADRLYPVTKEDCWSGRLFDLAFWERATRNAYALHYWEGTWFRTEEDRRTPLARHIPVRVTQGAADGPAAAASPSDGGLPLISCLMVTKGRIGLAKLAIAGFLQQSYPNRELVIVTNGPDDGLDSLVHGLGRPEIRLIRLADATLPLGQLRNLAVEAAAGRYVCQWDDDDLCDPQRLEYQYLVLSQAGAQACLLGRWMMWWPNQGRLAVSRERDWEGSLLCEKAAMPRYPHLRRGEDTPVVEQLRRTVRVVSMDLPRLYTYVVHGDNTFGAEHFETHWQAATTRFTGERCGAVLREMGKRLPVEAYRRVVAGQAPVPAQAAPPPKVLVLTPVKDALRHLPRFLELLDRLAYEPACLSVGFLESDSADGTHDALAERLPSLRERYRRVELLRHDHGFRPDGPRWAPAIQRRRRDILARSRNRLLTATLRDEDWVLWLDVDLVDYPPDLLTRLLGAGRDIIVPHCVLPDGRTFDLNSFRFDPSREAAEDPRHLVDGIFQPPPGEGRLYLDAFHGQAVTPVDGVGGTALLVRADLHREGLCFPPYPHRGYIETEGLAMMAKDMGVTCWALPNLRVVHADH